MRLLTKIISLFFILCMTPAMAEEGARIVAVGSGVTETLYALHMEKEIVAVDISSNFPPEAKKLPQIGYQRTLTAESILGFKPTMLIGTKQTGPEATLTQLKKAGVQIELLDNTPNVTTVKNNIMKIATLVGKQKEGETLWNTVESDLEKAKALQKNITEPKRVLFLLTVPGRAPLVAGKDTEANLVLELAGAKNVATNFTGYQVLTPEAVQALNPDVILLADEGVASLGGLKQIASQPGFKNTNAVKNNQLIAMDTNLLLSMGPRFGLGVLELTKKLN